MTDEELRRKMAELILDFQTPNDNEIWDEYILTDQILTLIREAGLFMDTEMVKGLMFEVQAQKCAKCPKNKEGQP